MKAARFVSLLIFAVHVFGHLASAQSNVVAGRKVLAPGTFEESSKGRVTRVAAGHVYPVRTKDSKSDFHVLFRVEELLPNDQVTISYRVVAPPKPDRQRHHQEVWANPNVTVVGKKWRIDVRNPALEKDPVEAMNERDRAERQRKATERNMRY